MPAPPAPSRPQPLLPGHSTPNIPSANDTTNASAEAHRPCDIKITKRALLSHIISSYHPSLPTYSEVLLRLRRTSDSSQKGPSWASLRRIISTDQSSVNVRR